MGGFNHLYTILITADVHEMMSVASNFKPVTQKQATQKSGKKSRSKLIKHSESSRSMSSKKFQGDKVDNAKCLSFLISIIKIFLQASLLTVDQEKLNSLIFQSATSPFKMDKKVN
jgi:hypothetical protein